MQKIDSTEADFRRERRKEVTFRGREEECGGALSRDRQPSVRHFQRCIRRLHCHLRSLLHVVKLPQSRENKVHSGWPNWIKFTIKSYPVWSPGITNLLRLLPVDGGVAAIAGSGEREGEVAAPDPARPPRLLPSHQRRLLVASVLLSVVHLHRAGRALLVKLRRRETRERSDEIILRLFLMLT